MECPFVTALADFLDSGCFGLLGLRQGQCCPSMITDPTVLLYVYMYFFNIKKNNHARLGNVHPVKPDLVEP